MEDSREKERNWVGRVIRGLVYAAALYVVSLVIMPSSALGLTPGEMVPACLVVGISLALYVTRKKP